MFLSLNQEGRVTTSQVFSTCIFNFNRSFLFVSISEMDVIVLLGKNVLDEMDTLFVWDGCLELILPHDFCSLPYSNSGFRPPLNAFQSAAGRMQPHHPAVEVSLQ